MNNRLENKTILITQCSDYMGPAINELFANEGARMITREGSVPNDDHAFDQYVKDCEGIDVLVANLAHDPRSTAIADIDDNDWMSLFDTLVHPLMRLIRHFGPLMAARGHGKIVAITSAAPLRGIPGSSAYCTARGAQNALVRVSGLEFAPSNVQINAVAQNYVRNPQYYPDDLVASERFQKHLQRNVPVGRVAEPGESAELALFLASDNSDFIVGQVIPFSGGWATNT